jgi:hypothetical protein
MGCSACSPVSTLSAHRLNLMLPLRRFAAIASLFTVLVLPGLADSTAPATAKDFYFPSTGVGVDGQAMLLGIDEYLLPLRDGLGT